MCDPPPPPPPTHTHNTYTLLLKLCMPDSLVFSKNLVAPEGLKFFHSFLITRENGTHAYGSSLTFYEEVRDTRVLNTLESLQTTYRESRMIISPNSDREKYFSRSQDKLFVNKCICFVTSKPIVRPCQALLEQLYAVSTGRQVVDLPLESYVYNVLYEVPLPPPGKRVKFSGLGLMYLRVVLHVDLNISSFCYDK